MICTLIDSEYRVESTQPWTAGGTIGVVLAAAAAAISTLAAGQVPRLVLVPGWCGAVFAAHVMVDVCMYCIGVASRHDGKWRGGRR